MELTREEIQAKMQEWKRSQDVVHSAIRQLQELRERQRVQFTKLFGSYVPAEYQIGDKIRVRLRREPPDDEFEGQVIWSYGPGETPVTHRLHPLVYVVDAGRGIPVLVHPTEIVQRQE
jgi:hypothetical protein